MHHRIERRQAFYYLAEEMPSLIAYQLDRAAISAPYAFVQNFCGRGGRVISQRLRFDPLCVVIGGYYNLPISGSHRRGLNGPTSLVPISEMALKAIPGGEAFGPAPSADPVAEIDHIPYYT